MKDVMGGVRGSRADLRIRYSNLIKERFLAMTASGKFKELQACWLSRLDRRRPFPSIDAWVESELRWEVDCPQSFAAFTDDLLRLSRTFAVASWHVKWAMFVQGHTLDSSAVKMFPADVFHTKVRLLTSGSYAEFLAETASGTGIYIDMVPMGDQRMQGGESSDCMIGVDIPLELPPDLAVLECQDSLSVGRDILRRSGTPIPFRSRASDAVVKGFFISNIPCSESKVSLSEACHRAGLNLIEAGEYEPISRQIQWLAGARLEVVFSPEVKADVLASSVRRMIRSGRQVLKALGIDFGVRLRHSPLADQTSDLKVDGSTLPKRGLGDLADEHLERFPSNAGAMTDEGIRAVRTVKSRRGKLKKRLMRKGLIRNDED